MKGMLVGRTLRVSRLVGRGVPPSRDSPRTARPTLGGSPGTARPTMRFFKVVVELP